MATSLLQCILGGEKVESSPKYTEVVHRSVNCPECEGAGMIADEGYGVCAGCHGQRTYDFTIEYKEFVSDLWGYELPLFIQPSKSFEQLIKLSGWDYFAHELIQPYYEDEVAGVTSLTNNLCLVRQRDYYLGLTDEDYYLPL